MINSSNKINSIKEEIRKLQNQLNELERIKQLFPDIEINVDRWGTERYSSFNVNQKVNDADIVHSCGCCEDAPLFIWPFIKIDGIKIYSKPASFYIGRKHDYGIGDSPDSEWENTLKEADLPDAIIKLTKEYFDKNPPEDCYDNEKGYRDYE